MREAALEALRATPGGEDAALIGEISEQPAGSVLVTTRIRRQPDRRHAGGRSAAAASVRSDHDGQRACRSDKRRAGSAAPGTQPDLRSISSRAKRAALAASLPRDVRPLPAAAAACWPSAADPTPPTRSTSRWNSFIRSSSASARCRRSISRCSFAPGSTRSFSPKISSWASGRPKATRKSTHALDAARQRGAMTFALPGADGSYALEPSDAASVHPSGADRDSLSHALGNRARLLRAPRTRVTTSAKPRFLYPFLGRGEASHRTTSSDQVAASIR